MCFWPSAVSSIHKKCDEYRFEFKKDFKGASKAPDHLWIMEITYQTVDTDKFRRMLPWV